MILVMITGLLQSCKLSRVKRKENAIDFVCGKLVLLQLRMWTVFLLGFGTIPFQTFVAGWPVVLRYTYAYFITSLSLLWPRYLAGWLAVSIAAQVTYLIQVLYTIVLADATAESKGGIHSSLMIINFFFSSEYVCYVVARNKTILLHFPMCVWTSVSWWIESKSCRRRRCFLSSLSTHNLGALSCEFNQTDICSYIATSV